ncbi:helix-turn-helix domain-containing protein [Streptomyces ziwulingensis]
MHAENEAGAPLGRLLRQLRQSRRLTIEELAEASGVSGRAIGDMERGRSRRPHRGTLTALAQGLRLDEATHSLLVTAARTARAEATARSGPAVASPFTLPRGLRDFVGRADELEALRALAAQATEQAPPRTWTARSATLPTAVVSGPPGSGKTALAVRLAEQLAPSFPDGCFLLDLRGLDAQPLSAEQAALRLLTSWGVPDAELARHTAEEHLARYYELAAERRVAVVLDNAATEAQVRPLLPREGRSLVVVTSRRTLAGLEGVHRVELGMLTDAESASLLRAVLGARRVDTEPEAVRSVIDSCGRLPLALRVAANWAATRTNWSLGRLAGRLADEERRLDALSAGDLRVNSAFALSYSKLAPGAALMFRLLSLAHGTDIGLEQAAVLRQTSPTAAEDLLEELVESGLLLPSRDGRYRLHDLLRLYAASRNRAEDGAEDSRAARARARSWLLDSAVRAGGWFGPDGAAAPGPSPDRLLTLDSRERALRWIKEESDNWLAAFRDAAEVGEHAKVAEVAEALNTFSENWVSWGHWPEIYERAAAAGAALGDATLQATHLNHLSWAYWACERRQADAVAASTRALALATAAADPVQQAWSHDHLGWLRIVDDDWSGAADEFRRATELFAEADHLTGFLQASGGVIPVAWKAGRPEEALTAYRGVMDVLDDPLTRDRVSRDERDITALIASYHVSYVYLDEGRWREAADLLASLRGQLDARGSYWQAGKVYLHLAHALTHLGRHQEAAAEYRGLLAMTEHIPAAVLAEARTHLDALNAGEPSPPTRFPL